MRLPQSCSQSPSIGVISIILCLTFSALVPLGAQAGTQPLACSPASLSFGQVALGQSETQLAVLTNSSTNNATISGISVSESAFTVSGVNLPVVLSPGQSLPISVTFAPAGKGWTGAKITLTSNPNFTIQTGGAGVTSEPLTATPSSLSFGSVAVGASTSLSVVLTNSRPWKEKLAGFQKTGNSNFTVSGPSMPMVLSPGQSVTVSVTFAPQSAGTTGGNLFVSGADLNIPFSGTGSNTTAAGQLSVAPATLNFGNVDVGTTTTQASTMTATGGSVIISSAASSNSQFAIAGATFPMTITAGQSVQVNLVFSPTKSGSSAATLTLASNASNSQTAESLTGTGVTPTYSVNLSWNASTSSVAGYNLYRGTSAGSYSKINSSLDASAGYSDNTVASGVTYYYAATAVNSSGEESSYSSPLKVVVP